jgi:sugar (pentulose or hexulose) kinase
VTGDFPGARSSRGTDSRGTDSRGTGGSRGGAVTVAAVDLGASSGRVMVARVGPGELALREVHRFPNVPVRAGGTLHWDILRLYADMLDGLGIASGGGLASVGIDSWGVDYGLLDRTGALLGNPVHYRDTRTETVAARVQARIPAAGRYATTGIQELPFNTIYQLTAAAGTPQLDAANTLLLIPDLLGYWLTGQTGAELTNASTTQLVDVRTGDWAWPLIDSAGIPRRIFPALRQPGSMIGPVLAGVMEQANLAQAGGSEGARLARDRLAGAAAGLPVVAVGSHDTASAVVAVPARSRDFAYISSGTWSLVGMELDEPVLSDASRRANFTNEAGVDGRIRYLHNVTGLWLLQESLRVWAAAGHPPGVAGLDGLLADAARLPPLVSVVDADDPAFLPPGDMPERICAACARLADPVPAGPPEIVRCILDSLALAYRRTIMQVQELSGRHADVIHMVGGGTRNELLCQLTADACALPVIAGPVEAAALGNALIQARALGATPDDLDGLRGLVSATQELRRFEPRGDGAAWETAAGRIAGQSQRALSPGANDVADGGPDQLARIADRSAGPAHVLVRPDEDKRGAEVLPPARTVQVEHGQRDAGIVRGGDQATVIGCPPGIGRNFSTGRTPSIRCPPGTRCPPGPTAADQREPGPQVVVKGVTRRDPAVRQPLAGRQRQRKPRPRIRRPHRAASRDRRASVGIAEHEVKAVELPVLGAVDGRARGREHSGEFLPGSHESRIGQFGGEGGHIAGSFGNRIEGHWRSFGFIRPEKRGRRPAVEHGGEFPGDIHGVPDAGVEAVAAVRRVLVRGVAGDEHAPARVPVGQLHARGPGIGGEDLDRCFGPGHGVNDAGRMRRASFGCDAVGDAPPCTVQIEPSHQPGLPGVQDPVLDRVAVRDLGR